MDFLLPNPVLDLHCPGRSKRAISGNPRCPNSQHSTNSVHNRARGGHSSRASSNTKTKFTSHQQTATCQCPHGPYPCMIAFLICSLSILDIATLCGLASSTHTRPDCGSQPVDISKFAHIRPRVGIITKQTNDVALSENSGQLSPLTELRGCPESLVLQFSGLNEKFVINLVRNEKLISEKYFQNYDKHRKAQGLASNLVEDRNFFNSHEFLNLSSYKSSDSHCHYQLSNHHELHPISLAAISIAENKTLDGIFIHKSQIYYLHTDTNTPSTILTTDFSLISCPDRKNLRSLNLLKSHSLVRNLKSENLLPSRSINATTDNFIRHEPFRSNASSLYVELLVVHDHSQYIEFEGNIPLITSRTLQIVNIMNAFYRQLNIFISLVGSIVWTEKDEITLTEDGDATLTSFLKYRYEVLLKKYQHDNAQLITSTSFNGSVVGKALKGPICTHQHSGGVNTDHSHLPAIVAVTLAHELGHNFGMEHDEEEKCQCPDDKCIMSASSTTFHPKHWSSCSIEYLEESRKTGLLDCLVNRPVKVYGPVCGNGFVEDGEDCDPGEPIPSFATAKSKKQSGAAWDASSKQMMANPCCDRKTCKFSNVNATCAQGPCCDLSKCSVYNSTEPKICRQRRGQCDFEEYCDGKSEYCPPDVHYHDGIECEPTIEISGSSIQDDSESFMSSFHNRTRAYCYNGKCANHESQCRLLWGDSGATSSDLCYEQNVHGNSSGHCGHDQLFKQYTSCDIEDASCGMLHCVHNQPGGGEARRTGKLNYGFESAAILLFSYFVMSNRAKIQCHGAVIDAGPSVRDPGMVPNGAACGDGKMCVNSKCVSAADIVYGENWCPSDCNGNGICDNTGVCHCNDGTMGTSCYQFFGSNFHLSLLLYMIMFFVPMIVILVYAVNHYRQKIKIWWFLHKRKIALREIARDPNHTRRIPYDIPRDKITISEPVPLNRIDNANRPFYDASTDAWAESTTATSYDTVKSPGFRLEPLGTQGAQLQVLTGESDSGASSSGNRPRPVRAAPMPPSYIGNNTQGNAHKL